MKVDFNAPPWLARFLRGKLADLPLEVVRDATADVAAALEANLKRNAQKGGRRGLRVRSGATLRGIRVRTRRTATGSRIEADIPGLMELHNRGAVIVPRRAPNLVFFIPGLGWRRSKRVVLPARGLVDDAQRDATRQFPAFVVKALARRVR